MEFLENSVLPQSAHHLELLKYLVVLAFLLLIPYMSTLLGTTFLSVIFNRKGNKSGNHFHLKFSKELVDIVTFNKSVVFALGIVPFLSVIFAYAQLFHLTPTVILSGFIFSSILLIVALVLVYVYKHSFHLQDLLDSLSTKTIKSKTTGDDIASDAESYRSKTKKLYYKSGLWGVIFLLVSFYLLAASIGMTFESELWESESFYGLIFSFHSILYFLFYVGFAFVFTSAVILFYYFRFKNGKQYDTQYLAFVRSYSTYSGMIIILLLPLLIVIGLLTTPSVALSGTAVWFALISITLLLVIAVLFYTTLKEEHNKYVSLTVYLLIAFIGISLLKDQFSFSTASAKQENVLAAEYLNYQNKLKESMGIVLEKISGADIYNGRCIACHQFDKKLVGPAYIDVLPKYEGRHTDLVKFIMNPVKVNPDFPPMPNQGLKPKEAEAVADYIVQVYKEKNK